MCREGAGCLEGGAAVLRAAGGGGAVPEGGGCWHKALVVPGLGGSEGLGHTFSPRVSAYKRAMEHSDSESDFELQEAVRWCSNSKKQMELTSFLK